MFFKQSGYKPRRGSMSSSGSGVAGSPPKEETKSASTNTANSAAAETTGPAASAGAAGRRRSSTDSKFAGLNATKRNSQDERKANWADQKPGQPGILGGMWTQFTKGS